MASRREKSPLTENPVGTIGNISTVWRSGRATRLPAWSATAGTARFTLKKSKKEKNVGCWIR